MKLAAALLIAAALPIAACNSTPKASQNAANMGVLNSKCPIMPDHPVDPAVIVGHGQGKVAFCCKGCIGKWNGLTDSQKADMLAKAK